MRSRANLFLREPWLAAFLFLAAELASSCGPQCIPCECGIAPAELAVKTFLDASRDGGPLEGAEVTFTGAESGAMACQPANTGAVCSLQGAWPPTGSYMLQVGAPGYPSVEVPVTMTVTPPTKTCGCSCPGATLSPSTVSL